MADLQCNTTKTAERIPFRNFLIFGALVGAGTWLDLWTKSIAFEKLGPPMDREIAWLIPDVFGFQTSLNFGALFGMGQGLGWLFCLTSALAFGLILAWLFYWKNAKSLFWTAILAVVSAGIFGNLFDRLGLYTPPEGFPAGGVRDWILVMLGSYHWPNFNLADTFLVVGAVLIFVVTLFSDPQKVGTKESAKNTESAKESE